MNECIYTNQAPTPIGPYSQAVRVEDTLYLSGQIGIDPSTGLLVGDTLENEARQVFANLSHVLAQAGARTNDVVRVDIFLTTLDEFTLINTLYQSWLSNTSVPPARQTVAVSALPKGARIEVSCIAHLTHK